MTFRGTQRKRERLAEVSEQLRRWSRSNEARKKKGSSLSTPNHADDDSIPSAGDHTSLSHDGRITLTRFKVQLPECPLHNCGDPKRFFIWGDRVTRIKSGDEFLYIHCDEPDGTSGGELISCYRKLTTFESDIRDWGRSTSEKQEESLIRKSRDIRDKLRLSEKKPLNRSMGTLCPPDDLRGIRPEVTDSGQSVYMILSIPADDNTLVMADTQEALDQAWESNDCSATSVVGLQKPSLPAHHRTQDFEFITPPPEVTEPTASSPIVSEFLGVYQDTLTHE